MASHFFFTDPGRIIAVIEAPRVVISKSTLSLSMVEHVVAGSVSSISGPESQLVRKVPNNLPECFDNEALTATCGWLRDLGFNDEPKYVGRIAVPLLFIADGIDEGALRILKRLKVRGNSVAAIDFGKSESTADALARIENELKGACLYHQDSLLVIRPEPSCTAVLGLKNSVIGVQKRARQIIKSFPHLRGARKDLNDGERI